MRGRFLLRTEITLQFSDVLAKRHGWKRFHLTNEEVAAKEALDKANSTLGDHSMSQRKGGNGITKEYYLSTTHEINSALAKLKEIVPG